MGLTRSQPAIFEPASLFCVHPAMYLKLQYQVPGMWGLAGGGGQIGNGTPWINVSAMVRRRGALFSPRVNAVVRNENSDMKIW